MTSKLLPGEVTILTPYKGKEWMEAYYGLPLGELLQPTFDLYEIGPALCIMNLRAIQKLEYYEVKPFIAVPLEGAAQEGHDVELEAEEARAPVQQEKAWQP